ncbi:MAG: DUF1428 family protein, partial [Ectothiorhodospiraceae bacterium]|nr:DUF1428 family protein [Ectothiorhodospiraceae bacterium]
ERIVLAWVVWADRAASAAAHEGIFADPRMGAIGEMPFDGKRMILGGFEPVLVFRAEHAAGAPNGAVSKAPPAVDQ